MKIIVINADDFGYCHERNKGMIKCIQSGAVSSVSLMVNGIAADDVKSLNNMGQLSVGLHFNITEGNPISDPCSIPSLLDEQNLFRGKFGIREAVAKNEINKNEVEIELRSQIKKFKDITKFYPKHVDGHHHVHIIPEINEVFARVLSEENIKWTRLPVEINISNCDWIEDSRKKFYEEVSDMAENSRLIFLKAGLKFTDGFLGMKYMGKDMTENRLEQGILETFNKQHKTNNETTTVEIMAHPGFQSLSDVGGCGAGVDPFSISEERVHEISILTSKKWKDFLQKQDIRILSYNDI